MRSQAVSLKKPWFSVPKYKIRDNPWFSVPKLNKSKYIRIKGTKEEVSRFKNKDRVYVYITPNLLNFDEMCHDADYEVDGDPIITLNDGEVMLTRLSGDDEY